MYPVCNLFFKCINFIYVNLYIYIYILYIYCIFWGAVIISLVADGRWFGDEGAALWKAEAPETVPELLDDECLTTSGDTSSMLTIVQPMVRAGEEDDEVISKASLDARSNACKEFASKRLAEHC